jgi:hypothetical protein
VYFVYQVNRELFQGVSNYIWNYGKAQVQRLPAYPTIQGAYVEGRVRMDRCTVSPEKLKEREPI